MGPEPVVRACHAGPLLSSMPESQLSLEGSRAAPSARPLQWALSNHRSLGPLLTKPGPGLGPGVPGTRAHTCVLPCGREVPGARRGHHRSLCLSNRYTCSKAQHPRRPSPAPGCWPARPLMLKSKQ